MQWYKDTLTLQTKGQGLYPFTLEITGLINKWEIQEGMCYLFIPHTSASLVISESYDPTARKDLESFMNRIAPEGQPWHDHTLEGADDSPSHMRAMLTDTSLTIPIDDGHLSLGRWQGVYIFEHRRRGERRQVLVRCLQIS